MTFATRRTATLAIALGLAAVGAVAAGGLDTTPPRLDVKTPERPVSGVVTFGIHVEDDSGVRAVTGPETLDTRDLPDGEHEIRFAAVDRSPWRNRSEVVARLVVDNTPPALEAAAGPAAQGRTTAIFIEATGQEGLTARFLDRDLRIYPLGGGWRALVGVAIEQPPGTFPLVIEAWDEAGNRVRRELAIEVAETTFEHGGFIRLTHTQTRARRDEPAIAKMRAERDAAYAHEQPEARWSEPFARPIVGRRTSTFGKYRTYSDGERRHHTGTDLANRRGTPVHAAAPGEVLVAGPQAIFGNVVIVHHGHGVATSYNHLDAIDVVVGQAVERGELVGRLGSTGQSTGPHLHWGLTVDSVAVDPEQWLEEVFLAP